MEITALGMIETSGLLTAIEAADAGLKAADVRLLGTDYVRGGLVMVRFEGEVAAVKSAVDAGTAAARFAEEGRQFDVIVVDPPRKGCDEATLRAIQRMAPRRLVYVSCNPATLARDLKILETFGFKTQSATPVDLFPRTHHVETIAYLDKQ